MVAPVVEFKMGNRYLGEVVRTDSANLRVYVCNEFSGVAEEIKVPRKFLSGVIDLGNGSRTSDAVYRRRAVDSLRASHRRRPPQLSK